MVAEEHVVPSFETEAAAQPAEPQAKGAALGAPAQATDAEPAPVSPAGAQASADVEPIAPSQLAEGAARGAPVQRTGQTQTVVAEAQHLNLADHEPNVTIAGAATRPTEVAQTQEPNAL